MLSVFSSPGRYTQGKNATESLGSEMKTLGLEGPVFVLAGASACRELAATWKRTLSEAGYAYTVFSFGGECATASYSPFWGKPMG